MTPAMFRRGQLVLPMLAMILLFSVAFLALVQHGRRMLRQMRVEMIAEAVALSNARAHAEVMNSVSSTNALANGFFAKFELPGYPQDLAAMHVSQWEAWKVWKVALQALQFGFRTYPAGVATVVARLNKVTALPLAIFRDRLQPVDVDALVVVSPLPPTAWVERLKGAYLARAWSPSKRKAQPPHRVLWRVTSGQAHANGCARLWLDVPRSDALHNGGFPRVRDSVLGGLGVQAFYPQFNARPLPQPSDAEAAVIAAREARS